MSPPLPPKDKQTEQTKNQAATASPGEREAGTLLVGI